MKKMKKKKLKEMDDRKKYISLKEKNPNELNILGDDPNIRHKKSDYETSSSKLIIEPPKINTDFYQQISEPQKKIVFDRNQILNSEENNRNNSLKSLQTLNDPEMNFEKNLKYLNQNHAVDIKPQSKKFRIVDGNPQNINEGKNSYIVSGKFRNDESLNRVTLVFSVSRSRH